MFREEPVNRKRGREKSRLDPAKSQRPDPGKTASGPGRGGVIGTTGGTLLTQYIMKHQVGFRVSISRVWGKLPTSG